ncbi:hypothetical protein F5Y17DRAFT_415147 [Xylariaceae sp. FL0594]|nr:hypothetical protein F5Y17DRAFT_415147 [Xylariaceae sp. FL0594]
MLKSVLALPFRARGRRRLFFEEVSVTLAWSVAPVGGVITSVRLRLSSLSLSAMCSIAVASMLEPALARPFGARARRRPFFVGLSATLALSGTLVGGDIVATRLRILSRITSSMCSIAVAFHLGFCTTLLLGTRRPVPVVAPIYSF